MSWMYPLKWSPGFPRTPQNKREPGQFKTDRDRAMRNVRDELARFSKTSGKPVEDVEFTSNLDSMGNLRGSDPGVAVWFRWDGLSICIGVDRYASTAANMQAIFHVLEARRTELRHGTLALVRASLSGLKALPAPESCWQVLGLAPSATAELIGAAYRDLARRTKPDDMARLNVARDTALAEIGAKVSL